MIETRDQWQDGASRPVSGRPRVAVAHDWLCGYRGGEAVLERLCALVAREYEPAGLLTMFDDGRPLGPTVDAWRARGLIRATRIGVSRVGVRARRWLLPVYPSLVASLSRTLARLHAERPIDLLISTSSAAVKGIAAPPGVPHLCYCHAPARYVWAQRGAYGGKGLIGRLRAAGLAAYGGAFRRWDRRTAVNVSRFVANSTHTAAQVLRCYGRDAEVVFPPVRTGYFTPGGSRERFWLVVSALEPYKRVDAAIEAARLAGAELIVAGDGSQRRSLSAMAGARLVGRVSDEELRRLYRSAAVLLFPQVEDFGIVAVEAQACGLPVVAARSGGASDIVRDRRTGVLVDEATPENLARAVAMVPPGCAASCRENAERFSEAAFDGAMLRLIRESLAGPIRSGSRPPEAA